MLAGVTLHQLGVSAVACQASGCSRHTGQCCGGCGWQQLLLQVAVPMCSLKSIQVEEDAVPLAPITTCRSISTVIQAQLVYVCMLVCRCATVSAAAKSCLPVPLPTVTLCTRCRSSEVAPGHTARTCLSTTVP